MFRSVSKFNLPSMFHSIVSFFVSCYFFKWLHPTTIILSFFFCLFEILFFLVNNLKKNIIYYCHSYNVPLFGTTAVVWSNWFLIMILLHKQKTRFKIILFCFHFDLIVFLWNKFDETVPSPAFRLPCAT